MTDAIVQSQPLLLVRGSQNANRVPVLSAVEWDRVLGDSLAQRHASMRLFRWRAVADDWFVARATEVVEQQPFTRHPAVAAAHVRTRSR